MKHFSLALASLFLLPSSFLWAEVAPVPVIESPASPTLTESAFLELCTAGVGNDISPEYVSADGQSFYSEGGIVCFGKSPLRIASDVISLAPITDKRKEGVAARSFTFVEVQGDRAYVTYKEKDYDFSLTVAPVEEVAPTAPVPEAPAEPVAAEVPAVIAVEESSFPWLTILGGFIIVVALGAGGFIGYRKYRAHKKMMDMPPAAVIPTTPAPVPDIVMADVSAGFPMPHTTQSMTSPTAGGRMTEDSIIMPVSTPLPPMSSVAVPPPSEEVAPTHPM